MTTLEQRAGELCGNYLKWRGFGYSRSLDSAGNWCIVYTSNRDSRLLDESNAAAIEKIMAPFADADTDNPDVLREHHTHWACGYVDGYAIRVYYDNGNITPAFQAWHGIQEQLESYPVLDEDDYSEREYEATCKNVEEAVRMVANKFDLEEVDASKVHEWLADNDCSSLESTDEQGGYPDDEAIETALTALGYLEEVEEEAMA